jgi:hypothetical protein
MNTYEPPIITEVGKAEDLILGSGNSSADADNQTHLV